MRNQPRTVMAIVVLTLTAACSGTPEQPALTDDLKQDLARAGGSDVQLAGGSASRLDVVSASERMESAAPAPRERTISRTPSAVRGTKAAVRSIRPERAYSAESRVDAPESAPVEVRVVEVIPEPIPASAGRPRAPQPSTQREPPGGWSSPGTVMRNAPFPINP